MQERRQERLSDSTISISAKSFTIISSAVQWKPQNHKSFQMWWVTSTHRSLEDAQRRLFAALIRMHKAHSERKCNFQLSINANATAFPCVKDASEHREITTSSNVLRCLRSRFLIHVNFGLLILIIRHGIFYYVRNCLALVSSRIVDVRFHQIL